MLLANALRYTENGNLSLQKRKSRPSPRQPAANVSRVEQIDWDLLRVFLAIMRTGKLALAATRLGVDVSTVSRRLDRLEAVLGVVLFERLTSGVTATAAAEKLLPPVEEMARALGQLGTTLDTVEAEAEGIVRLSAPPGLVDVFLAPALARFHARHPLVRIDLDASAAFADLTRGEADLALRTHRPARGDLVAQRLVTARWVAAGARGYVGSIGTLRKTEAARWIGWSAALAQLPDARWMDRHVPVPPVLRTGSFIAQLEAAAAGLGLVLAPEPFLDRFGLVPVRVGRALAAAWADLPVGEIWLVGHVALRRVPRVDALWRFLVDELTPRASAALKGESARDSWHDRC